MCWYGLGKKKEITMNTAARTPAVPKRVDFDDGEVDKVQKQGEMGEMESVGIVEDENAEQDDSMRESKPVVISVPKFESLELNRQQRARVLFDMMGIAGDREDS